MIQIIKPEWNIIGAIKFIQFLAPILLYGPQPSCSPNIQKFMQTKAGCFYYFCYLCE